MEPNSKSDNALKLIKKLKSKNIIFWRFYIDYKVSKILKSKFVFCVIRMILNYINIKIYINLKTF